MQALNIQGTFFDCFLSRLAASPYSKQFVLKGGLYLSFVLGVESRSTVDVDFIVRRLNMEHDPIVEIVKEICEWPVDDNVIFNYIGDSEIKKDDVYGGWSITIEGRLENVRQRFDIDIATFDVVYPGDCDYAYRCLVTNEVLQLKSYSLVSAVAEKTQTFLSKGVLNSRTKDLYDMYVLEKSVDGNVDDLKIAFAKTCKQRNYEIDKQTALKILGQVESNSIQRGRWETYSTKVQYAKETAFDDVINCIGKLIDAMF